MGNATTGNAKDAKDRAEGEAIRSPEGVAQAMRSPEGVARDARGPLDAVRGPLDAVREPGDAPSLRAWTGSSRLRLLGAGYSYGDPAVSRALCDVSLEVRGFARVGIVGASGSGKSTLVGVLAGFGQLTEGSVEVDGVALPDLRMDDWRAQVAYIPQNPRIFSASLRDNIAFYKPGSSDEEVMRAVAAVGLEGLVGLMPRGLDTFVGEGGRWLSGGQAQRLSLARAFLDDRRRVLVFDEPTAHLDIETELELKERALPLMKGRLVFFATHRLHWLADMDLAVVLSEGRAVQVGSPEELLSREGELLRLANLERGAWVRG